MSRRVSHRLATKAADPPKSNKANSLEQPSSPSVTPAPTERKATANKRATAKKRSLTDGKPTADAVSKTSKSASKPTTAATKKTEKPAEKEITKLNTETPAASKGTKRKRAAPPPKDEDDDELPHNMGKRTSAAPKIKQEGAEDTKSPPKISRNSKNVKKEEQLQDTKDVVQGAEAPPKKRAKKANPYGLTPGETPFPDWPHPTAEEAKIVHDLLLSTIEPDRQKRFFPPDDIPAPSELVAGCGEVPCILDALIRTLLSAATSGKNSSASFQGLVQRFGLATIGIGKGSVDWNAVHEASLEDVFEAIKCGGLAETKSKNIKKILAMVHTENQERLAALLKAGESGEADKADEEEKAERALDLRTLQQGVLTLDYYHHLEKDDAMTTFAAYPGIGVKTAACVNLFCMQRPCFAVDTHVFRLCQYLGWVPPDGTSGEKRKKADRNTTFSHCEVRIPDELKYGLHQLFLEHGKNCPRCRAITGEKSEGWADANCVIEHLVKRLGAKKGGIESPKKTSKGKKSKKEQSSDDEDIDHEDFGEEQSPKPVKKSPAPKKGGTKTRKSTSPVGVSPPVKRPIANTGSKRAAATKAGRIAKATPAKARPRKGKKSAGIVEESDAAEDEHEEIHDMPDLTDEAESSAAEAEDEEET